VTAEGKENNQRKQLRVRNNDQERVKMKEKTNFIIQIKLKLTRLLKSSVGQLPGFEPSC